jgi:hypothetical protein
MDAWIRKQCAFSCDAVQGLDQCVSPWVPLLCMQVFRDVWICEQYALYCDAIQGLDYVH